MLNVHPTNEPCGCCWNCWKCCMLNCWWFTSRNGHGAAWGPLAFGFSTGIPPFPVTNDETILDISWNCFRDGLLLYESMLEPLLWPVTARMRRASMFSSPRTVTVVALIQWLVKCGEIPALDVIFFIISARDLSPTGELRYHIGSTSGLNFAVPNARGFC